MVHGRQGYYLEAWKFSLYVALPIVASVHYSNPETNKYWADYWQYIKYPENPNTNVKEKIQKLIDEKESNREQLRAYQQQLQRLQEAAERSSNMHQVVVEAESPPWWRRAGRWIVGSKKEE